MIEATVRTYLDSALDVGAYMQRPESEPSSYVLIEKTGSTKQNRIESSTIAVQSYAGSLYEAASLNEAVKSAMDGIVTLNSVSAVRLNSDYNFTDTTAKRYRYQAVFVITHY